MAVIVVLALANSPTSPARSTASTSPAASGSPARSGSPSPSARQLSYDQLRPGDCVRVPDISTISAWPSFFTVVPCAQPHTGEVFFTGDIWPQSIAYPGDNATNKQAGARCGRAFTAYDGIPSDQSAFNYAWISRTVLLGFRVTGQCNVSPMSPAGRRSTRRSRGVISNGSVLAIAAWVAAQYAAEPERRSSHPRGAADPDGRVRPSGVTAVRM